MKNFFNIVLFLLFAFNFELGHCQNSNLRFLKMRYLEKINARLFNIVVFADLLYGADLKLN